VDARPSHWRPADAALIDPNRLLIGLLVAIVVLDNIAELATDQPLDVLGNLAYSLPVAVPLIVALMGRGNKALYWLALFMSWLLVALAPVMAYDYYLFLNGEAPYDDGQSYDYISSLIALVIVAIGAACHARITRTHPSVNRTKLDHELNCLFVGMMQAIVFGFIANMVLLALCVAGDWTFSEVLWIYWLESVAISGFTTWTITTLKQFDSSAADFSGRTIDEVKKELVNKQLRVGVIFYAAYLGLLVFFVGTPEFSNYGYLLLLLIIFIGSHYFGAKQKQQELKPRRPRLERMLEIDVYRIAPMHFTILLAMMSFGEHNLSLVVFFVLLKALIDIIVEIIDYRHMKLLACDAPASGKTNFGAQHSAKLSRAKLSRAKLSRAKLSRAKLSSAQRFWISSIALWSILVAWTATDRFINTLAEPSDAWIRQQLSEEARPYFEYAIRGTDHAQFRASVRFSDGTEQAIHFYRPLTPEQVENYDPDVERIAQYSGKTVSETENQRYSDEVLAKNAAVPTAEAEYQAAKLAAMQAYRNSKLAIGAVAAGLIVVPVGVFLLICFGVTWIGTAIVTLAAGIVTVPVSVALLISYGVSCVTRGVRRGVKEWL
jgi:hypothetical protein